MATFWPHDHCGAELVPSYFVMVACTSFANLLLCVPCMLVMFLPRVLQLCVPSIGGALSGAHCALTVRLRRQKNAKSAVSRRGDGQETLLGSLGAPWSGLPRDFGACACR